MTRASQHVRRCHIRILEQTIVLGGQCPARLNPMLQTRELHPQDGGLQRGQTIVVAFHARAIALLLAPTSQQSGFARILRIIGGQHAAFARRTEVLGGIKTEAADVTDTAGAPTLVFGAMGLRGVFDDHQLVTSRDLENRIHVGALTIEMHQQNSARALGNGGFDLAYVDVEGGGVDIHEYRGCADVTDGRDGGIKRERNGDHFIAWSDARGQQSQMQGAGSRNSRLRHVWRRNILRTLLPAT